MSARSAHGRPEKLAGLCIGGGAAGGRLCGGRPGRAVRHPGPFAAAACVALGPGDRSEAGISDLRCHYAALSIETADGRYAAGNEQDSGLTMTITEMPLAEKGLPEIRAQIAEHLFAVLQSLTTPRPL